MRVFFAAPLFNEAERDFNQKAAELLRGEGFDVWLAQEHKFIGRRLLSEKREILEEDLEALRRSDLVVAVLDGLDVDTGVAFEMGFAHALGKQILGLKTDHRVFSEFEPVNLMLEAPLAGLCRSLAETIEFLRNMGKREKR
ncbi:MAG: nucleoside 2-deoxyribosyltransferase [Promethearchaeati archaeon SRVP18_Atabeyarchaeia-1]